MEDGERGHREGLVRGWQSDPGDGGQARQAGCWGGGVQALLFAPLDTPDISGWNSACEPLLGREILSLLCQNPTRQPCIWPSEVDKRLTTPRRLCATTFTRHSTWQQFFSPLCFISGPGRVSTTGNELQPEGIAPQASHLINSPPSSSPAASYTEHSVRPSYLYKFVLMSAHSVKNRVSKLPLHRREWTTQHRSERMDSEPAYESKRELGDCLSVQRVFLYC